MIKFTFVSFSLLLYTSILYCSEPPKKDKELKRKLITKALDNNENVLCYKLRNLGLPMAVADLICKKDKYNDLLERSLQQQGTMNAQHLIDALFHGADTNAQTLLRHARHIGMENLFLQTYFNHVHIAMQNERLSLKTLVLLIKAHADLNKTDKDYNRGSPLRDATHLLTKITDKIAELRKKAHDMSNGINIFAPGETFVTEMERIDKNIDDNKRHYHLLKQKIALLAAAGGKYFTPPLDFCRVIPQELNKIDERIGISTSDSEWIPEPAQAPYADEINFVSNCILCVPNIKAIHRFREKNKTFFSFLPKDLIHPLEQFVMEIEYPNLQ